MSARRSFSPLLTVPSAPVICRAAENSALRRMREVIRESTSSRNSVDRLVAERLAGLGDGRPEILLERERLAAPVLGELAQHVELVVAEVGVGEHHQGQQFEGRHVLAIGGGVHATPRYSSLRRSSIASDVSPTRPRRVNGTSGDGDAVAAGEVGADLDRIVAGGDEQLGDTADPGQRRSRERANRRRAPTAARRRRSPGWRRARPARRTVPPAAPTPARPARRQASRRRCTADWLTTRSSVVPAGRASNHDPAAMRTLRPRRPSPARLARATSIGVVVDVGHPHGDTVERQLVGEGQPDRSRTGAEVGDGQRARQRARQLDGDAGDDLGLRPRDQDPAVDGEVEVAKAPVAEHVRQRLTGEVALDHLVEMGDHARRGRFAEHALEAVDAAARLLAQPPGDRVADAVTGLAVAAPASSAHRRRAGGIVRRRRGRQRRRRGRRPARRRAGRW